MSYIFSSKQLIHLTCKNPTLPRSHACGASDSVHEDLVLISYQQDLDCLKLTTNDSGAIVLILIWLTCVAILSSSLH